jgi:hypothetical protein
VPGVTVVGTRDDGRLPHWHLQTDDIQRMDFDAAWRSVGPMIKIGHRSCDAITIYLPNDVERMILVTIGSNCLNVIRALVVPSNLPCTIPNRFGLGRPAAVGNCARWRIPVSLIQDPLTKGPNTLLRVPELAETSRVMFVGRCLRRATEG